MNSNINRLTKTRQYLLEQIKELSAEQLNKTPEGFNNNIIWNLGHMIAAQQGICYVRSGNKPVVDQIYFETYKPGTKPTTFVDDAEIDKLKETALSSIEKLASDIEADIFNAYPSWTTRYGVDINNIEEALEFLLYHEGLHAGAIMALKKLV